MKCTGQMFLKSFWNNMRVLRQRIRGFDIFGGIFRFCTGVEGGSQVEGGRQFAILEFVPMWKWRI